MISRRGFLVVGLAAGGGLAAWYWRGGADDIPAPPPDAVTTELTPIVSIGDDDTITVTSVRTEMGQGSSTGLAMLVAEELEVDFARVRVDTSRFDPRNGRQGTTASNSMNSCWEEQRRAGAVARELLVAAAAEQWGIERSRCQARSGVVHEIGTARSLSYAHLVQSAARLAPPTEIRLKDPSQFRIVGKPMLRLDTPSKVDGSAVYGIDAVVPGALVGLVARAPSAGAHVRQFDARAALAVEGVRHVVAIGSGIAVVADDTWAAKTGRQALVVDWDEPNKALSSADIDARLAAALDGPCKTIVNTGDVDAALAGAAHTLTARYQFPLLAHATMEPVNATAFVETDRCTVWAPTQAPGWNVDTIRNLTKLPASAITIHRLHAGGGFGRKSCQDFITDAVQASRAAGAPVKIVFTREDDIQHDFYRPPFHHRIRAGLDARGKIIAWDHRLVGPSVLSTWRPEDPPIDVDYISVAGADTNLYASPHFRAETAQIDIPIPRGIWRSIGNSNTCHVTETIVDELAALAGREPIEFRLAHLVNPRARAVLVRAAELASQTPLPSGRTRGVAMFAQLSDAGADTCVAEIAEISVEPTFRIHRVVCVIDCGFAINPPAIVAQMEGGIAFGLSAALFGEITIARGAVEQRNFDGYRVLRIDEMPAVEVHVMRSAEPPTGAGELAVPPIAPAIANARFAATGVATRRLPMLGPSGGPPRSG